MAKGGSEPGPGIEVVELAVNRANTTAFTGQQAVPAHAFILGGDGMRRLEDLGATGLEEIAHPFLRAGAMTGRRSVDRWILDLGELPEDEARRKHPVVMRHLDEESLKVVDVRVDAEEALEDRRWRSQIGPLEEPREFYKKRRKTWWTLEGSRRDMLAAIGALDRYVVRRKDASTSNGIHTFVHSGVRPDQGLAVYALSDDYSFGVLSSSLHRDWLVQRSKERPPAGRERDLAAYPWASFPWPQASEAEQVSAIAEAAGALLAHRAERLRERISLKDQYKEAENPTSTLARLIRVLDDAVLAAYRLSDERRAVFDLEGLNRELADTSGAADGAGTRTRNAVAKPRYALAPSDWRLPAPDVAASRGVDAPLELPFPPVRP